MAEAVIQNATPQQIDKLRQYTHVSIDTPAARGLHDYYAEISGNRVLQRLHGQVQGVLTVLFGKAIRTSRPTYDATPHIQEEKQIIQALEAREVSKLREAIKLHIQSIEEFLLSEKVARSDR
jgi:DNA-binding FadR family transcriptional regulator